MKNRTRREKLSDLLFDLVKYILTIGVIGSIVLKQFDIAQGMIWIVVSVIIVTLAYFLTPPNEE